MDIQKVFEANTKFISQFELDAELMKRTFTKTETREHLIVGTVDLPTGRIRIGDALAYMGTLEYSPELNKTVNPGSYPVELAFITTKLDTVRITAARIKLSNEEAVKYELAEPTHETTAFHCSDGDMTGFPVDAGVMGFMDVSVMEEYSEFLQKWHEENPDKNHYDDYFAAIFNESYEKLPQYQRGGGDFIEWSIPETGHRVVINSTGFGDGFYQVFWGIDKNGEICEVTVPLINADLLDEANKEYLEVWDGIEACIVTNHIADGGEIAYMCREESEKGTYNGWVFYGYDENDEYWDNADNFCLYSTHGLAKRFPNIIPLLHSPAGTAYFGNKDGTFEIDDREE